MIKRYDISDSCGQIMIEEECGDWVSHEDHIKEVERLKGGWISVDDQSPKNGQKVLATYSGVYDYAVVKFWRDPKRGHYGHQPATHWMPLPEPPGDV